MAGRPSKLTPVTKKKLIDAIKLGAKYNMACNYAGITYRSFAGWMAKGKRAKSGEYFHFFHDVEEAKTYTAMVSLKALHTAVKAGDAASARWLLSKHHQADFGNNPPQDIKHSGEITSVSMTADQWKKERERRLKEAEETRRDYEQD